MKRLSAFERLHKFFCSSSPSSKTDSILSHNSNNKKSDKLNTKVVKDSASYESSSTQTNESKDYSIEAILGRKKNISEQIKNSPKLVDTTGHCVSNSCKPENRRNDNIHQKHPGFDELKRALLQKCNKHKFENNQCFCSHCGAARVIEDSLKHPLIFDHSHGYVKSGSRKKASYTRIKKKSKDPLFVRLVEKCEGHEEILENHEERICSLENEDNSTTNIFRQDGSKEQKFPNNFKTQNIAYLTSNTFLTTDINDENSEVKQSATNKLPTPQEASVSTPQGTSASNPQANDPVHKEFRVNISRKLAKTLPQRNSFYTNFYDDKLKSKLQKPFISVNSTRPGSNESNTTDEQEPEEQTGNSVKLNVSSDNLREEMKKIIKKFNDSVDNKKTVGSKDPDKINIKTEISLTDLPSFMKKLSKFLNKYCDEEVKIKKVYSNQYLDADTCRPSTSKERKKSRTSSTQTRIENLPFNLSAKKWFASKETQIECPPSISKTTYCNLPILKQKNIRRLEQNVPTISCKKQTALLVQIKPDKDSCESNHAPFGIPLVYRERNKDFIKLNKEAVSKIAATKSRLKQINRQVQHLYKNLNLPPRCNTPENTDKYYSNKEVNESSEESRTLDDFIRTVPRTRTDIEENYRNTCYSVESHSSSSSSAGPSGQPKAKRFKKNYHVSFNETTILPRNEENKKVFQKEKYHPFLTSTSGRMSSPTRLYDAIREDKLKQNQANNTQNDDINSFTYDESRQYMNYQINNLKGISEEVKNLKFEFSDYHQ